MAVILVAENDLMRRVLAQSLRADRIPVIEAEDGFEALSVGILHEQAVERVLCQADMTRMPTVELRAKLLARLPDLKISLVTTHAPESPFPEDSVQTHHIHPEWVDMPITHQKALGARLREILAAKAPEPSLLEAAKS